MMITVARPASKFRLYGARTPNGIPAMSASWGLLISVTDPTQNYQIWQVTLLQRSENLSQVKYSHSKILISSPIHWISFAARSPTGQAQVSAPSIPATGNPPTLCPTEVLRTHISLGSQAEALPWRCSCPASASSCSCLEEPPAQGSPGTEVTHLAWCLGGRVSS